MGERIWMVDNEPSQRYPVYSRGNVGEVFPEAVAPLTWTLGAIPYAEPGFRDALVRFGAFSPEEFNPDEMEMLGCFGGYAYLNVSIARVLAVRTPGLTPELMDQTFWGESDAPPYEPQPTDESPEHTAKIEQTLAWILTTDGLPELLDDRRRVDEVVAARPDLASLSDRELVERARDLFGQMFRDLFAQHIHITYCATVPVGIIQAVSDAIGDPSMAMRLIAGIGDVDSAAPSFAMFDLSRLVRSSAPLSAEFDAGTEGLLERLEKRPDAGPFLDSFRDLLEQFGSRGPNEWEMRSPTWGTHPDLALAAIDRMRFVSDDARPQVNWEQRAAEREALAKQIEDGLASMPEVLGQFQAAMRAAQLFLAGRERTKTNVIKMTHEGRLALNELGRRMVDAGHFDQVTDYGMLTAAELDDFLAEPARFREVIRERADRFGELRGLEPPFIVHRTVPPISEWRRRDAIEVERPAPGTVLTGISGCPGTHTAKARVVTSPDYPMGLEPGEILIAPITDPAWTPLFVPAGAVVVDVGAQASHAVIVARELGIPCVVSVTDATRKIPSGTVLTVDGTAGTVTVVSAP